jgi:alpha-N-acetylglucosamine transferase
MFNKFQLLNLIEYDKIFFLDADIILNDNMDNEFENIKEDEIFHLYSETF